MVEAKNWAAADGSDLYDTGASQCITIQAPTINCAMQACHGSDWPPITGNDIYNSYIGIKAACEPSESGGQMYDTRGRSTTMTFMKNEELEINGKRNLNEPRADYVSPQASAHRWSLTCEV